MEEMIWGSPEKKESGTARATSFEGGSGGGKRRGRPRKYDAEGKLSPAYAAGVARKAAAAEAMAAAQPPGFSLTTTAAVNEFGEIFADSAGADFTPHVITVQTGEDVSAKIHSVGHKAPRGICVLSANGTISNVTIRQPGSSGGLLTYEGRFEILSLTGSYTVTEAGGITSKNGGLSITLAGPDGRVTGGSVAGWIIAANPIQVVVGSFVLNGHKASKRKYHRESHTASMMTSFPETTPAEIPNSQPMLHYHEAGPPVVSPVPAHSQSEADDSIGSGHNLNVVSSHDTPKWNNGSEPHRLYPDSNVSVAGV